MTRLVMDSDQTDPLKQLCMNCSNMEIISLELSKETSPIVFHLFPTTLSKVASRRKLSVNTPLD